MKESAKRFNGYFKMLEDDFFKRLKNKNQIGNRFHVSLVKMMSSLSEWVSHKVYLLTLL